MYKHQAIKVLTAAALLGSLVTPVHASPQQSPFIDIDQSYAKGTIEALAEAGILEGVEAGRFSPAAQMTRQDFMIILARSLGLDAAHPPAAPTFTDIPQEHYAYPYIEAAVKAGLVSGMGDGLFGGALPLSRQDMAVIFTAALGQAGSGRSKDTVLFKDAEAISDYARDAVARAAALGLIEGSGDGSFHPTAEADRQAIAMVAGRFLQAAAPVIQRITSDAVYIGGRKYSVSEPMQGILHSRNQVILKGAKIRFEAEEGQISQITYLELRSSGSAAVPGGAEFSSNLVLNGQQGVIDGTLKVAADYITLKNLTIAGDLEISRDLQQDFYSDSIDVQGKTLVNGGDRNTVVFKDSTLTNVDINKEDVRVEMLGQAFVQGVTISSNAALVGSSGASIDQVTLKDGAQKVELQASVDALQVNTAATITGNASIAKLTVDTSAPVTLGTTGTVSELTLTQQASKVTLGTQTQVQNLTLPTGATASSLVTNYTQVQSQVGAVNGVQTTSAPAASSAATTSSSSSTGSSPKVAKPISDFTITMGTTKEIDLSEVFTDADNNITTYKAQLVKTASAPEVVTATVNENILTIEPRLKGKITVRAQAFDSYNNKAADDFIVTVNQHPVAADIPEQYVTLNAGDTPVNLNMFFTDPDLDVLSYQAEASDHPEVATGAISGSQLILTPVGLGSATITVTATDNKGGSVSKAITVKANRAPAAAGTLADQVVTIGQVGRVDVSGAFGDLDGDTLTYEVVSQDSQKVAVAVQGSELLLTPADDGQTTVTVTAKDARGGRAAQTFNVRTNRAPQVAEPAADQDAMVGAGPVLVDFSSVFSDVNQDSLTLQAVSADPSVASVNMTGQQLEITPAGAGSTTVTITADDHFGGTVTASLLVRVNVAPAVGQPVTNLILQENGIAKTVDLSGAFTDVNADPLTLTAAASNTAIATVSLSGTVLTAAPLSAGSTDVTVTASDGRGGTASSQFTIQVNRSPVAVGSLTGQLLTLGAGSKSIDFSGLFSDPDNDTWTLAAESADPQLASVSVTGKQVLIAPVAHGATTLTVTASDGRGGSLSRTFTVEINRAPHVVNAAEDKAMTWGDSDLQLDVSQMFSDADLDTLTLEVESLTPSVASAILDQQQQLTVHPLSGGTAQIRVTAKDGRGGEQSDTFTVRINRAPQGTAIPAQTLTMFSVDKTLDLSGIFTDADGDALVLSAISADPGTASLSLSGSQLTLKAVAVGTTSLSVTADDGHGGTLTRSFAATVQPNQAPTAAGAISTQWLKPTVGKTIDLLPVFSDADGDALTYSADSSDAAIAAVTVSGSQLTITGVADGQAAVTVTAADAAGNSASTTFTINVASNESPVATGTVPLQLIGTGVQPNQFSIAHLFSDPDNDAMTYTAAAADGNRVQASITGSTLTLAPGAGPGRTTVTVTASDGRGGVANAVIDVLNVQIVNRKQIVTKMGVAEVSYDLTPFFPTQNPLTAYRQPVGEMTPDTAQVMNSKLFKTSLGNQGTAGYWVIAGDGTGAFIEVTVQEQQGAGVYFAEYTRGPEGRIALEFFNQTESEINYKVIGYRYNLNTRQMEVMMNDEINSTPYALVNQVYPGKLGIIINYTFYDAMDITPIQYFHGLLKMTTNGNDGYVISAFELVKNGQVVDVIGDKNWTPASGSQPFPEIGTMIRKKGIRTGSSTFSLSGEWDVQPLTYMNLFSHTP